MSGGITEDHDFVNVWGSFSDPAAAAEPDAEDPPPVGGAAAVAAPIMGSGETYPAEVEPEDERAVGVVAERESAPYSADADAAVGLLLPLPGAPTTPAAAAGPPFTAAFPAFPANVKPLRFHRGLFCTNFPESPTGDELRCAW